MVDESDRVEQDGFVSDYHDWFKLQAPGEDPDKTGLGWNSYHAKAYALKETLHPTHWIGQTAVDFIRTYNNEKPLFLKVSFERPHSPYDPPQRCVDMYDDVKIPPPAIGGKDSWDQKFAHFHPDNPDASYGNFGVAQVLKSKKYYYANITFVDELVGKVIAMLKKRDMYDNALICFLSDHGDMMGDHYHWRKTYGYEGSARVPFIIKWPENFNASIEKGSQIEEPVGLQDFLPTFLHASGQQIPEGLDGMSLLNLVEGKNTEWRKYIGMEHSTCYHKDNYWAGVTDGKSKYLWFFPNGEEQFFDLVKDPGEKNNLAGEKGKEEEVGKWRNYLVDYLRERGDGFVKNNQLMKRSKTMLYSPNYPKFDEEKDGLRYWKSVSKDYD